MGNYNCRRILFVTLRLERYRKIAIVLHVFYIFSEFEGPVLFNETDFFAFARTMGELVPPELAPIILNPRMSVISPPPSLRTGTKHQCPITNCAVLQKESINILTSVFTLFFCPFILLLLLPLYFMY